METVKAILEALQREIEGFQVWDDVRGVVWSGVGDVARLSCCLVCWWMS